MKRFLIALFFISSFAWGSQPVDEDDLLRFARDDLRFAYPTLVVAIAKTESSLNPGAVSHDKDDYNYGLMQLRYHTAKMVGFKGQRKDLYNWRTNVTYSVKYLSTLLEQYNGNIPAAVAAYNAGKVYVVRTKKGPRFKNQKYVDKVMKELLEAKAPPHFEVRSS